jgi:hypothetical protein
MKCFFSFYNFESVLIPCKFSVSSLKMITISNHNQKLIQLFKFLLYNMLQLFLTHHIHYTPFICGKNNLKF